MVCLEPAMLTLLFIIVLNIYFISVCMVFFCVELRIDLWVYQRVHISDNLRLLLYYFGIF